MLPPEIELVDPPTGHEASLPGGTYRLSVSRTDDGAWVLEREVAVEAFRLDAAEHAAFLDQCRGIDSAERTRLRFTRSGG